MKKFARTLMFVAVLLFCGTACVQNGNKVSDPHNFAEVDKNLCSMVRRLESLGYGFLIR